MKIYSHFNFFLDNHIINLKIMFVFIVIASMFISSSGAALSVHVMNEYGTLFTLGARLAWAALILLILVRPAFWKFSINQWLAGVSLGFTVSVTMIALYTAITRIPLGLAIAIDLLGPLAVGFLGIKRGWRLVWPIVAFIGVLFLVRNNVGWSSDAFGIMLAFCAATAWACYIMLTKRVGSLFSGLDGTVISFTVSAGLVLSCGFVFDNRRPDLDIIKDTFWLAILTPLIPQALDMIVLRRLSAATYGVLRGLGPAIAAVTGFVVLGQTLGQGQLAGILLVLVAASGVALTK